MTTNNIREALAGQIALARLDGTHPRILADEICEAYSVTDHVPTIKGSPEVAEATGSDWTIGNLPTQLCAIWVRTSQSSMEGLRIGPDHDGDWYDHDGDFIEPDQIRSWRFYTGPESAR